MDRGSSGRPAAEITVRRMEESDIPAVLQLLQASLGWVPNDEFSAFFRWKHLENPFGESPAWVAWLDGRVVGLRTFLRWDLRVGEEPVRAVRAVDTATHPDVQGRGLFRRLTLDAVDQLRDEGVDWVFNTPNASSRPGYLKMGWSVLGRPRVTAAVGGVGAVVRLLGARVPATKWSERCDVGEPAADALAAMADTRFPTAPDRVGTARSVRHLRWRYGFPALGYRALPSGRGGRDLALFRVRRRGPATEAAVCDVLGDDPDLGAALRAVVRATGADVALGVGPARWRRGALPLPRQGPLVTVRQLSDRPVPPLDQWALGLGDLELM